VVTTSIIRAVIMRRRRRAVVALLMEQYTPLKRQSTAKRLHGSISYKGVVSNLAVDLQKAVHLS
jgi:hypothetical protein